MDEQQAAPDSSQQADTSQSTPSTTGTLDDVYKQYNVEVESTQFQPKREQQAVPQQTQPPAQPLVIPDPVLDPQGYSRWQSQQQAQFHNDLNLTRQQIAQMQRAEASRREESDIQAAVSQFKSIVGDAIDADLAEVALGQRARKDPKFAAVYNNRQTNPQAWKAAVNALGNEWKGKTQFKTDPQLAENVRAAKQSIQGSQNRPADAPGGLEGRFNGKVGKDFVNEWNSLVHGNSF
jgi:hypothetical protein